MISKEKLLNGYVSTKDEQLVKLMFKSAIDLGIAVDSGNIKNWGYVTTSIGVMCGHNKIAIESKQELTLSDFKPQQTRTEYEKLTIRDYEALQEFHAGKEFYHKPPHARNHNVVPNVETLIQSHVNGWLYCKVEKEIDWREEVNKVDAYKNGFGSPNNMDFLYQGGETEFLRMCHLVASLTNNPE